MADSAEDTDSVSSASWLEDSLINALKGLNLDVNYWLDILKTECEVTDDDEIRLCEDSEFKNIEKLVQHDWEIKVLMQMLNFGGTYDKNRMAEKEKAQQQEEQCSQLLGALVCERDKGKTRSDNVVKEHEQKLKQTLQIPDDVFEKTCKNLSLDGLIDNFNSQLGEIDEIALNRNELSPHELLKTASDGLALKGILVTNNAGDFAHVRETVLRVPNGVVLNSPGSSQLGNVEFCSHVEADSFYRSLDILGYSIATTADGGKFAFQTEAGFSSISGNDKDESEICLSKVKLLYIPTASCQIDKNELKLSESLLHALKELEKIIEVSDDETIIQPLNEEFLKKYGSHVNVGNIVFGGIYNWQATYCSEDSHSEKVVQGVVDDALVTLVNMSYSGLGVASGGTVSGDQLKADVAIAALHEDSTLSNVTLSVSTTGGPQGVQSLPLWKIGLALCSETWAIIDRGCSFHRDFVGLWELIEIHLTEFADAGKLAQTLQDTWRSMIGLPPDPAQSDDEVENAKTFLSEILENDIHEWINDESFSKNAVEYLETLLDEVKQCCIDPAGIDFWVMKLNTDKGLNSFLKCIMEINEYSHNNLRRVYHYFSKILTLAQGHDYPLLGEMKEFVSTKVGQENVQGILENDRIKDIPSLIAALKETLLPKMEACGNKSVEEVVLGDSIPDAVDDIHLQVTKELEIVVDNHLVQLESANKPYELLLLRVAIHEVNYDYQNKSFPTPFSEQSLSEFSHRLENHWEEFRLHKEAGVMEMQAFLIQLLILSLQEDSKYKEADFQEFIREIHKLLVTDMAVVLARFTSSTPYHWNCLLAGLDEMKKGNKYVLQLEALDISAFDEIYRSENHKFHSQIFSDETVIPDEDTHAWKLLEQLGLTDYYPSKISLQDVMAVGNRSCNDINNPISLPWRILQKLIMLDYNARDQEPGNVISENQEDSGADDGMFDTLLGDFAFEESDDISLNPLDIFLSVYSCCDMMLKQTLVQKMVQCRLAVPFLTPQLSDGRLTYSLWALRSTIVEWKNKEQVCMETSVVDQPIKTVSFLRLGKPSVSKSVLLNNIISDQAHHTFWNRECPLGHSDRSIANGLVEAQWYIPAGKATDTFEDMTMFLNLRGDACQYVTQVEFLQAISDVVLCCIETSDLDNPEVLRSMKNIHSTSSKVVLLLANKDPELLNKQMFKKQSEQYLKHIGKSNMANTKTIPGFKGNKVRTTEDLKREIRTTICKFMSGHDGKSLTNMSFRAKEIGIQIDEDEEICKRAKELADEVISCMGQKSTNDCKREMLPLQGDDWQEWSKLLKDKQYSGHRGTSDIIYEKAQMQLSMTQLRQNQLGVCNNLSNLMKSFLGNLQKVIDSPAESLYLQWLKIYFDEKSRSTLPGLHREYHKKWLEFYACKKDVENASKVKTELEAAERQAAEASLGMEHLFREVAQMYEAALESKLELSQSTRESFYQLPTIAAKLLLKGQPLEIMDGDAANVPLTWVKAVFSSLANLVGDKKLFVISVLGIQSSGKSTLLNTMFGLQFAVSAGRCTRGVYMQLIKVDKERSELPYDYVLVVDTEGLRAPELGQMKHSNDNQLATFVIGLGDVTILNIKGENVAEVSDVLQIAVHAFLRMKIVNKNFQLHRTCVFIHQNVPAVNAKEKMQRGCQKLKERLDEMTREASAIENIVDIQTFNEVIEFDGETNVWYFSDLWHGDPPMAPANPGYSEKVQEVKDCLLNELAQKQASFLSFLDLKFRVEDLWKGVLSENFVFSFKNSLAAKAYNSLESIYHEKSWDIENSINEWITEEAVVQLERCSQAEELDRCCLELLNELQRVGNAFHERAHRDLEHFFETHSLKDIVIEWKTEKMECLNSETKLFLCRGELEIQQKKDHFNNDLLQKKRLTELNVEIMTKAQNLANEMKGMMSEENELQEKFEVFWIERQNDYANGTTAASIPIEGTVEHLLYKRLGRDSAALEKELRLNPLSKRMRASVLEGSISCTDIIKEHLSVRKTFLRRLRSLFSRKVWQECQQTAVDVINTILQSVDTYLGDINKLDSGFQERFAKNVIKRVVDGVEMYNSQSEQASFTLLPNLLVKIAVHACRYAVGVFLKMQREYEENHGIQKKLNSYRNAAWNLFKNTLKQSKIEVIAADFLSNHLEVLMQEAVRKRMSGEIVNHVVRYFNHTKFHLIVRILTDLTERPFADYQSFISCSKDFALSWVTSFTNGEMFHATESSNSKYANYADLNIEKLGECIRRSIQATAEVFQQTKSEAYGIQKWVEIFCNSLRELPIKEEDLKPVLEQNIKAFEHFEKLLLERLKPLEENVLAVFQFEREDVIKWEDATPYSQILDKLWGCEAQCPFCEEVCQRTDPNHLSPNDCHQCIQHRPSGVAGVRIGEHGELWINSCNFDIQTTGNFGFRDLPQCRHLSERFHPYREYKKFLPDWDIAPSPNMESSTYWLWVMAKYKHQLANMNNAQVPDIPAAWDQITKQEALDSLRVYAN